MGLGKEKYINFILNLASKYVSGKDLNNLTDSLKKVSLKDFMSNDERYINGVSRRRMSREMNSRYSTGSIYTPKNLADFMCKKAIINFLARETTLSTKDLLINLLSNDDNREQVSSTILKKFSMIPRNTIFKIQDKLRDIRILDPSCGTGIFLERFLVILISFFKRIREVIEPGTSYSVNPLEIIRRSLHGLDVDPMALLITRIRLLNVAYLHFNGSSDFFQEDFRFLDANFKLADSLLMDVKEVIEIGTKESSNKEGFDIVIGNPPYIRQEMINHSYMGRKYAKDHGNDAYKKKIHEKVLNNTPGLNIVNKKSDYYVYFILQGLNYLVDGGILCFLTSNSWLDALFGIHLKKYLLKATRSIIIMDSSSKEFIDAEIHAILLFCEKTNINLADENKSNFFPEKITFCHLNEKLGKNQGMKLFLEVEQRQRELEELGEMQDEKESIQVEAPDNGFRFQINILKKIKNKKSIDNHIIEVIGNTGKRHPLEWNYTEFPALKWRSLFLNDSSIYRALLKKGKGKFTTLSKIADVNTGCYSSLNDFFYIDKATIEKFQIEKDFCKPLIRNERDIESLKIRWNGKHHVLCIPKKSEIELKREGFTGVLSYISWGSKQRTRKRQKTAQGIPWPKVSSIRTRKYWYSIPASNCKPARLFIQYISYNRFYCPYSESPISSDRCFHRVFPKKGVKLKTLAAILNSSLQAFFVMFLGRCVLGKGALKAETRDVKNLLVVDPDLFSTDEKYKLVLALDELGKRKPLSLFDEYGLDPKIPINNQVPAPLPDRKKLDNIIFNKLGLTKKEKTLVYQSTAKLVMERLSKSKFNQIT
ncbi:MAG: Eco57I restriction-modification methylase domain-containing protein [Promethearchaeota archaeon]